MTVKKPLCPQCKDGTPGFIEDDYGNILRRCPCRYEEAGDGMRKALAATADANPEAINAAVLIITDAARRMETFSANTIRVELDAAQIPGPVVGAAFGKAAKQGIIRRDGYVPSTLGNTHGHEVKQWRSMLFGRVSA